MLRGLSPLFCSCHRLAGRSERQQQIQGSGVFFIFMKLGHWLRALCVCTWRKRRSRVLRWKSCVCSRKWLRKLKCPSCQTVLSASEWGEATGMWAPGHFTLTWVVLDVRNHVNLDMETRDLFLFLLASNNTHVRFTTCLGIHHKNSGQETNTPVFYKCVKL